MLVNTNHILRYAEEKQCYIGAFDMPNLEILMAAIRAAEKREEPVIIQHTRLHECRIPTRIVGPIMMRMVEEARVPVCAMLDHGEDLNYVKKTLDLGFSAIMYGGSSLVYGENVAMTREVVTVAKTYSTGVEAEIGIVTGHGGKTFAINDVSDAYTDSELVARYAKDTGIDVLAASVGTVHGFCVTKPELDFDWIVKVKELTGLPLIMHRGSGISIAGTQRAVRCGIRKINYFSYMSNADVKTARKLLEEKEVRYFYDLTNAAVDAMEQDVLNAMSMFVLK